MRIEVFGEPGYNWELPFECEIHCGSPKAVPDKSKFSVLNHTPEPPDHMISAEDVKKIGHLFDLILTYDEHVLELPNAVKLLYGDQWVSGPPKSKNFSLSNLYSRGLGTSLNGYLLRREIWDRKHEIKIPLKFWTSTAEGRIPDVQDRCPYPYKLKDQLFESMFSVIIENKKAKNYFSEKLLDALRSYTVPIYFGCPNVSDYFDQASIIQVNDVDEFLFKVNNITPDMYWEQMSSMDKNFKLAENYINYGGRMKEAIIKAYNNK
jgi:hypothetical protein